MPDVVVIGGGIGGLTAAVALQRRGFDAHVYEAAPELRAVGAGITVPPNAMRALDDVGMASEIADAGLPLERMEIRDVRGTILQTIDGKQVAARHGHALTGIRRSDLQRIIADALATGTLHHGRRMVRYVASGDHAAAEFDDGTSVEAALLVAADGLRSVARHQMRPEVDLRYSGQTCLRGLAPMRLPEELFRTAWEIWEGASRFGFLEVAEGSVYWYAPYNAPAQTRAAGPDMKDRLVERYHRFPAVVRDVIEATPAESIVQTDLYDIPPMRGWSDGRVVLLGDAAHAMTPNLGQGGAQAIEDALSLATKLKADGIGAASLAAYERARAARTHKMVALSWRLGQAAHWKNPVARGLRNLLMRSVPARIQQRQTDDLLTPQL